VIYGISGASSVGKTTLGTIISTSLDIKFLRSSVSEASKKSGYNPVEKLDISERIDLQELILKEYITAMRQISQPVIIDRTPINFIAYMLAEIGMFSQETLSDENMERIWLYIERCKSLSAQHFDIIFHLGTLPYYESSTKRPPKNIAYQNHCDLLMRGVLSSLEGTLSYVNINTSNINQRVDFVIEVLTERFNEIETFIKSDRTIH